MLKAQPDTDQEIKDDKRSRGSLSVFESAMKLFDFYCKKQGGSIPEADVLGYGISLIFLNIGMYFVAPAIIIIKI